MAHPFPPPCTSMVLTGFPCQTFPRPRPEEGPEPSAELLLVAIHLFARQIDSIDIIRLFRISKQFSRRLLQIIWSNDVQLHLNQLPDLASTATSCAALPQPRSSRLLAANTRAAGGAWGARMTCTRVSIACSVYLRASDLISVGAKGI